MNSVNETEWVRHSEFSVKWCGVMRKGRRGGEQ